MFCDSLEPVLCKENSCTNRCHLFKERSILFALVAKQRRQIGNAIHMNLATVLDQACRQVVEFQYVGEDDAIE